MVRGTPVTQVQPLNGVLEVWTILAVKKNQLFLCSHRQIFQLFLKLTTEIHSSDKTSTIQNNKWVILHSQTTKPTNAELQKKQYSVTDYIHDRRSHSAPFIQFNFCPKTFKIDHLQSHTWPTAGSWVAKAKMSTQSAWRMQRCVHGVIRTSHWYRTILWMSSCCPNQLDRRYSLMLRAEEKHDQSTQHINLKSLRLKNYTKINSYKWHQIFL